MTIDIAAFIADPWSRGGLTVIHPHHDGPRGLFATAGGDRGHHDADLLTIVHVDQSGVLEIARDAHWEPVDAVTSCYVELRDRIR